VSNEDALAKLDETLAELRAARGGRGYVLGRFSYADISGAQILGVVLPVSHPRVRMGVRTRARFTVSELAEKYRDLIAWRDALYAEHREG
jgi:glutathione S-transferase